MSIEVLSALSGALSIQFQKELDRQFNRFAPLFAMLKKGNGAGPNLTWDVRFSRTTPAAAMAEGSDVVPGDLQNDVTKPAVLPWGAYRSAFGMSGLSISAAMTAANSPEVLMQKFRGNLEDAASDIANTVASALYSGSGASDQIAGLHGAGAILATGTYAGLARGTYAEWAGNTAAVGGALTVAAIDTQERAIFNRCGMKPTMIITTADIADQYAGLFSAIVRNQPLGASGSTPEQVIGAWNVNGFTGLHHKGIPIYRSAKCPTGHLYMLNNEYMSLESLPYFGVGDEVSQSQVNVNAVGTNPAAGRTVLNAKVEPLGKTGDNSRFQVITYVQLKVRKPNSMAVLTGVA
jgi:hypothetical protein